MQILTNSSFISRGVFTNQGQICLCGSRLFIQEEIYERFRDALVEKVIKIKSWRSYRIEYTFEAIVVSKEHMEKISE